MSAHIVVNVRDVYGKAVAYPACDLSRKFALIAGTKTLSHSALSIIESMGYEVRQASVRSMALAGR